jgi:Ca-activated chloride channel homolog
MRRTLLWTAPLLALAAAAGAQTFRAGVEVVSLTVTVTDSANRHVTGLERDLFEVYEDGVLQELSFFHRTAMPIALSVLIDTSASMEGQMTTAQQAAIGFVRRLGPQDFAQIIDFDSRVEILQPFTGEIDALEGAIRRTTAGGSTALYNALYIALKELQRIRVKSADEIRRQAIVLLSDGEDTSSLVGFDDVLDLAKRSETVIYTLGLRGRDWRTSRGFKEAEFVLRQLAQETGGRAFLVNQVTDLARMYDQISDELASQYTLGYAPKNPRRDGQWRRVQVRVNQPNTIARTKLGYYAPTSATQ